MCLGFWVMNFLIIGIAAGRRRRYLRIETFEAAGLSIRLGMGTPWHGVRVKLDSRLHSLVLMDADCGNPGRYVHCPRYCSDGSLQPAYCSPLCEQVAAAVRLAKCGLAKPMNLSKSSTLIDSNEEFAFSFRGFRPLNGKIATDFLLLDTAKSEKAREVKIWIPFVRRYSTVLAEEGFEFVRGLSFDRRYFDGLTHGALGVGTEPDGQLPLWLRLLKSRGLVDSAIITVQKMRMRLGVSFTTSFIPLRSSMTVGAVDPYFCRNWRRLPASARPGWTFEMQNVEFAGEEIGGLNFGRIALESGAVGIPGEVMDRRIADGFFVIEVTGEYTVNRANHSLLALDFSAGEAQIHLDAKNLLMNPVSTISYATNNGEARYTDEREWTFGSGLLNSLCLGYDYERGAALWGEKRDIRA